MKKKIKFFLWFFSTNRQLNVTIHIDCLKIYNEKTSAEYHFKQSKGSYYIKVNKNNQKILYRKK